MESQQCFYFSFLVFGSLSPQKFRTIAPHSPKGTADVCTKAKLITTKVGLLESLRGPLGTPLNFKLLFLSMYGSRTPGREVEGVVGKGASCGREERVFLETTQFSDIEKYKPIFHA